MLQLEKSARLCVSEDQPGEKKILSLLPQKINPEHDFFPD